MMAMKSGLIRPFLLLLLLLSSTVSTFGSVVVKTYKHFIHSYSWQDAQSYCRSSNYYKDLATIYTQSDADGMYLIQYAAWIGLYKQGPSSKTWYWTDENNNSFYSNYFWANGEPDNVDSCAFIYFTSERVFGSDCEESHFFICHELKGGGNYHYTFIPQSKTWLEARQYCKDMYDDLAAFKAFSDVYEAVNEEDFPVWTGLRRDGETWKWSAGLSEYRNWASSEPGDSGDCVSIFSLSKEMATQNCSAKFPMVCLRDNLVLVKENKTWEEALEHCRALTSNSQPKIHYELVSVQPGEDHSYIRNKVMEADTDEVWAGLRFLAGRWLWVNGANMLYSDLPNCPPGAEHCGVLSKNDTDSMRIRDCTEKRNFLCYGAY